MRRAVLLLLLLVGCQTPEEAAAHMASQTTMARAWCDRMGIRVTGVECFARGMGSECTVAPVTGTPFRVRCGNFGCRLPEVSK